MKVKSFFRRLKLVNHRHYIALGLIAVSVLFAVFKYELSYIRLFQSLMDLVDSVVFYFCKTFLGAEDITASVVELPKVDLSGVVSFDIEIFAEKFNYYWEYFFNWKNFSNYFMYVFTNISLFLSLCSILIPIFMLIVSLIKRVYLSPGDEEDKHKDTENLEYFKRVIEPKIIKAFQWCKSFVEFMLSHRKYIKLLILIWIMNLNMATILVGVVAFYFYFISSFNFASIPPVFIKLALDLFIMFAGASIFLWLTLAYIIVTRILKKRAYRILQHNEMKNRGLINAQPLVTLSCGTMGSKKTSSAVDMTLSTSVMFKDKALEFMIAHDMKFPNFPWLRFEEDLKECYEKHIARQDLIAKGLDSVIPVEETIYNLASSKYWVVSKAEAWEKEPTKENLWGYDFERYSMTYNDDLVVYHLFDVLIEYAQLYLIYVIEYSFIFGNLSVREDMYSDGGFLPMWNTDFFHRTPQESALTTRFAKIFDYDMFRLGKKMIENNVNSGAFEFGVVILTEIGKERKNNLENRENKKKSEETNQNNDLFNTTLKMIRHRATVCYYPFVRIITDEQRPESWGADARDLCSVMELGESSDLIVLYRGLFFDGFVHDIIYPKFQNFYLEMRNLRGDNTLLVYLFKNVLALLENRYDKLKNRFGFYQLPVTIRDGDLNGECKKAIYYISRKKTYSGRFATDSHADFFIRMAFKSGIGLFDFVEYQDVRQTEDEMKLQNSYFYLDMSKWSKI